MNDEPRKRPQLLDQGVLECVASRLFSEVKRWLEDSGEDLSARDEQGMFDVLVELLHHRLGQWDGYVLARDLEDQGWTPNSQLVEVLSDSSRLADHCLREEQIRWVHEESLSPKHGVGEEVRFKIYENEPPLTGRIVEVQAETLEFSIEVESGACLLIPQESILQD